MRKIILLALLLNAYLQNIRVISPEELKSKFYDDDVEGDVESSVSRFGDLSYLESNIVEVLMPEEDNELGCLPFKKDFKSENLSKFVILLERGECFYWQKILNAQSAGAFAVIVYHNMSGRDIDLSIPSGADQSKLKSK